MCRLSRPVASLLTRSDCSAVPTKRPLSCQSLGRGAMVGARPLSCSPAAPPAVEEHALLLARSYEQATGKQLLPGLASAAEAHARLWTAPFCLLSHGIQPSPIMNYGNALALATFEISWRDLLRLESRYTAPPMGREERECLLARVRQFGYVDDYNGVRITAKGNAFTIESATVWEVLSPSSGERLGQAATFYPPTGQSTTNRDDPRT